MFYLTAKFQLTSIDLLSVPASWFSVVSRKGFEIMTQKTSLLLLPLLFLALMVPAYADHEPYLILLKTGDYIMADSEPYRVRDSIVYEKNGKRYEISAELAVGAYRNKDHQPDDTSDDKRIRKEIKSTGVNSPDLEKPPSKDPIVQKFTKMEKTKKRKKALILTEETIEQKQPLAFNVEDTIEVEIDRITHSYSTIQKGWIIEFYLKYRNISNEENLTQNLNFLISIFNKYTKQLVDEVGGHQNLSYGHPLRKGITKTKKLRTVLYRKSGLNQRDDHITSVEQLTYDLAIRIGESDYFVLARGLRID